MTVQSYFLLDECLTADLVGVAINHGFGASHVKYRGLLGADDRALAKVAVDIDAIFVTNNARDFRRIYRSIELHGGLVIILPHASVAGQIELMASLLERWFEFGDTFNKLIEIDEDAVVTIIDLPLLR